MTWAASWRDMARKQSSRSVTGEAVLSSIQQRASHRSRMCSIGLDRVAKYCTYLQLNSKLHAA